MIDQPETTEIDIHRSKRQRIQPVFTFTYSSPTSDQIDLQQQALQLIAKWSIDAAKQTLEAKQRASRLDFVKKTCHTGDPEIGK